MRTPLLIAVACFPAHALAANDATFVCQVVPSTVTQGAAFSATITMHNTGDTTWSLASGYFLGSQSPTDSMTWGTNRFSMGGTDSVASGETYAFVITLTAPSSDGDYAFQWQVLQDGVGRFGQMSPPLTIRVSGPPAVTCDGSERICLDLTDLAAVQASGGNANGTFNADGFMPADRGGIDWHFGPGVDLSAGRFEVDVKGLLEHVAGQPEQVSIFEMCGDGAASNQIVGLQRMMMGYHGNSIFRYYATTDFATYGWQIGIWTDGFEATGWTVDQTHHFQASWTPTSLSLTIDGSSWNAGGTFPFSAGDKTFTLGARCTHYSQQHAVARFSNFRFWALGTCGNGRIDPGETCDGNCPTSCDDGKACTSNQLTGSASTCSAVCTYPPITVCTSGDDCCPSGCTDASDSDCPRTCGNGRLDPGETCDGNCPTSCIDGDVCTSNQLIGSASNCTSQCTYPPITACVGGDGCCAPGCLAASDPDCLPPDGGSSLPDAGASGGVHFTGSCGCSGAVPGPVHAPWLVVVWALRRRLPRRGPLR